ncbi:hypothetical protein AAD018_000815 [Aestuariibius insulae]|uniref:hypothetical protein n=1 Tax=Aestuariibius insulae TaxID=2058287 RepID=UPI00345E0C1D
MSQTDPSTGYRVDTHVHLYPGTTAADMLDAAQANMRGKEGPVTGMLCLTETATLSRFADLPAQERDWNITSTDEAVTQLAHHKDGSRIAIVAGRQIVTKERLEVLALGMPAPPSDGLSLDETVADITEKQALAVLPWGVGKWMGDRGNHVASLIDRRTAPREIFLADSAVRPRLWPRPSLLDQAEKAGWLCLAGSDPLPLRGDVARTGRYGIEVSAPFDPQTPFATFKTWLMEQTTSPKFYGRRDSTPGMVVNQILLRTPSRIKT